MKYLFCPQCGIPRFSVKNNAGDGIVVQVSKLYQIIPIKEMETTENYDTDLLFCLGCSWKGHPSALKKFPPQ